jgi:hypothetical protein
VRLDVDTAGLRLVEDCVARTEDGDTITLLFLAGGLVTMTFKIDRGMKPRDGVLGMRDRRKQVEGSLSGKLEENGRRNSGRALSSPSSVGRVTRGEAGLE